jgi:enoyl-CoA hydratase/carnithine racemase
METTVGYERITTEARGHVFLIGLNRPDKLNAFDAQMLRELAAAYTAYEQNHDLWCGVLFAHGRAFTAGLDQADGVRCARSLSDGRHRVDAGMRHSRGGARCGFCAN